MPFQWPWARREYPGFYQAYLAHFQQPVRLDTPISDLRFVVFDTETTGLNPRRDLLLSIGAVACTHQEMAAADTFDLRVRLPRVMHNAEAIKVHGILPGQHPEAMPEAEAIPAFLRYCQNAILVGHQVNFDVAMIDRALGRLQAGRLKNHRLDTIRLAQRVSPPGEYLNPNQYHLDALAKKYDIPLSDRHTAAGDAYITAILLMKLMRRLHERGARQLRDLMR